MAVMRTLGASVTVRDPSTFRLVSFLPGEAPPPWAQELITNPAVWITTEVDDMSPEDVDPADGDGDELVEPPREGRGSGKGAWQEYATALGVPFPKDATRDQIVELVDAATADDDEEDDEEDPDADDSGAEDEDGNGDPDGDADESDS